MTANQKAEIMRLIAMARGDDLARAERAFKHCTPEQMQEQYSEGGRTRAQVLAIYQRHEAQITELEKAMAEVPTT